MILVATNYNKFYEEDYQILLKKYDKKSEEYKQLKYEYMLLDKKDKEIVRLKALLNIDGTNAGIPTSQTPINKKKVIPNSRVKTGKKYEDR